jgi:hypothetical protein
MCLADVHVCVFFSPRMRRCVVRMRMPYSAIRDLRGTNGQKKKSSMLHLQADALPRICVIELTKAVCYRLLN